MALLRCFPCSHPTCSMQCCGLWVLAEGATPQIWQYCESIV